MDRIGKYTMKPFTKNRKNVVLVVEEGHRKNSIHSVLEIDVTKAREIIAKISKKTRTKVSFTGWIIKCVAEALTKYKELNSYRSGRNKIAIFEDVDIAMPVERYINGEYRTLAYILRKANEKSVMDITREIRKVQKEAIGESTQLLGKNLTRLERFALGAPVFVKKIVLILTRRNAFLKKKYFGTAGVTAIGMKGKFPGWEIAMGGTSTVLLVVGGITKKPGIVNDKIAIREYLHLSVSINHDLIDGGPLVRFVDGLTNLFENAFGLEQILDENTLHSSKEAKNIRE
ncbi:MAG: 2-oxo acid dehydrogenase subunit E2 [Candidatus Thermoplasmatota archaeon]|nr:2-oxo acid dehydrogenase subunit E2 [Candidatus Thermoplasmatota archaeon]